MEYYGTLWNKVLKICSVTAKNYSWLNEICDYFAINGIFLLWLLNSPGFYLLCSSCSTVTPQYFHLKDFFLFIMGFIREKGVVLHSLSDSNSELFWYLAVRNCLSLVQGLSKDCLISKSTSMQTTWDLE